MSTDDRQPPRHGIDGTWLVDVVGYHTCGAGDVYGHEPGCGEIPLVDLSTLEGWDRLVASIQNGEVT